MTLTRRWPHEPHYNQGPDPGLWRCVVILALADLQIAEARAEVERLREALRFYALSSNHRGVGTSAVYNDRGRLARLALGPCPTCTTHNGFSCGTIKTGRKIMDQDGPFDETKTCPDCWGEGIPPQTVETTHNSQSANPSPEADA